MKKWDLQNKDLSPPFKECSMCKHSDILYNIRGVEACLHCHLDRIWDYIEGTRRIMRGEE
jgi:hypothetical protein